MLTLTPGVAQPNYFQTGGINNPARSMQVTVNGAPNSNTVFRLDGVSATNQWIQGLQAYTPGIEAIETVNVVTNSFDAEQGMAGGASVNVQIKSGTNTLHGSAFEYSDARRAARRATTSCPPTRTRRRTTRTSSAARSAARSSATRCSISSASKSTVQRTIGGPYVTQASGSASQFLSLPTAAHPLRQLRRDGHGHLRSADRQRLGQGRVPFAFANCGITSTADPRFDACNFIPANRINQVARNILALSAAAAAARQREQLLRGAEVRTRISTRSTQR